MGSNVPTRKGKAAASRKGERDRRVAFVQIRTRREDKRVKRELREASR